MLLLYCTYGVHHPALCSWLYCTDGVDHPALCSWLICTDGAQHPVGAENDHADEGEKAILPVEVSF